MELADISTTWPVVSVALGACVLGAVLFVVGRVGRMLLSGRRQRERFDRASPIIGAAVVAIYTLIASAHVFGTTRLPPVVGAVVLGAAAWVAWPLLRDVLAGVAIKAGRVCRSGDFIDSGRIAGRVTNMGLRVLTLETRDGEEAVVPYGELAMQTIRRRPVLDGVSLHAFDVETDGALVETEIERRVREAALTCHWASVTRVPEVSRASDKQWTVTVFSLDERHATEIEAAVRRALTASDRSTRS